MSTPQEAMFNEAMAAVHAGDRARARDLFTRLLKVRQDNAAYWVWMSAVVETPKERAYCLKEALRIEPGHPAAQRGLLILGAAPVDTSLSVPIAAQRRGWQQDVHLPEGELDLPKKRISNAQIGIIGVVFLVVAGLIAYALSGMQNQRRSTMPLIFLPTNSTAVSGVQVSPTVTSTGRTTPQSLADGLQVNYTPTPLYVNTPHSVSEAYSIALRAYQREDWPKAQEFFLQALDLEPEAVDIHYYLGETYRQQGSYSTAVQSYNDAIERNERFAPAYLGRAQANLALNPKTLDAVEQDLQTALANDPGMVEPYLVLADLRIREEELQEALRLLDQASSLIPESPLVYLYRAEVYMAMKDPSRALDYARRANEMDVTLLPAYRMIGEALQAAGDFEGSLEPLNTYALYASEDTQVWSWIAAAQLAAGDRKAARQSLDHALEQDSRQVDALLLRGALLLEETEAEKALDDYELAAKIDPESFDAAMGTARALMALEYPGDAYTQIERLKILAVDEAQKAEWQFWRARTLDVLGHTDIALSDYQSVADLPEGVIDAEWIEYAVERIAALEEKTPTPQAKTFTTTAAATSTRQPTRTATPVSTGRPTATPNP